MTLKLLSYLVTVFTMVLGLLNWMALQNVLQFLLVNSSISRASWAAIEDFSFVLLGIVWLCIVLYSQHYYAKGVKKKKLWRNASFLTGIQVLLLFVCEAIPMLWGSGTGSAVSWLLAVLLFIVGVACIVFSRKLRRHV